MSTRTSRGHLRQRTPGTLAGACRHTSRRAAPMGRRDRTAPRLRASTCAGTGRATLRRRSTPLPGWTARCSLRTAMQRSPSFRTPTATRPAPRASRAGRRCRPSPQAPKQALGPSRVEAQEIDQPLPSSSLSSIWAITKPEIAKKTSTPTNPPGPSPAWNAITRRTASARSPWMSRRRGCGVAMGATCSRRGTGCTGRGRLRVSEAVSATTTALRYWISVSILNIGRYIAMMITPTISPTPIIISGSMIEVSDWIDASTSSS